MIIAFNGKLNEVIMFYKSMNSLPRALVLCTVAFSIAPVASAHAQDFLSKAQLLALIPGHRIDSVSKDGTAWFQIYSKGKSKGTIKGDFGGEAVKAKWFVTGDTWCENWGTGKACWQVEQVDATSLRMYENGKPKPNLWKLK